MNLKKVVINALAALSTIGLLLPASRAQNGSETKKGSWDKIKVHGKSLEGNLEGDSPDRDVFVYLPPSYATSPNRRYPVVYFLHGYAAHAENYWNMLSVPTAADAAIANGSSREMIVVLPDAFTVYNGSMFSNSPTTGDWEAYIAEDLVTYIDAHYRTIADRSATRARRTFDGRIWNDADRHETSGGLLGALCDEFLLSDERSPAAASRGGGESAPERRTGQGALRPSRRMGAEPNEPAAVLRSSDQGWRDPASNRGQMGYELAFGDGRPVCAEPQEISRNRHGRRHQGPFPDHKYAARPGTHPPGSRSQVRDI